MNANGKPLKTTAEAVLAKHWLGVIKTHVKNAMAQGGGRPLSAHDERLIEALAENVMSRWWERANAPSQHGDVTEEFTAIHVMNRTRAQGIIVAIVELVRTLGEADVPAPAPSDNTQ